MLETACSPVCCWTTKEIQGFERRCRSDCDWSRTRKHRRFLAMSNHDTEATWHYHEATEHSPQSVRTSGHYLDWATYPFPFKIYSDLDPIPLPRNWPLSNIPAVSAIDPQGTPEIDPKVPDLKVLASILFHAAGVTRRRGHPDGEIYFRAAACT